MFSTRHHPAVDLAEVRLKAHARRFFPDGKVWLFGSRAKQQGRRRSDFDLAVELGAGSAVTALAEFEAAVSSDPEIIYPVDVIDLQKAPPDLREQIRKEGILWIN
jgi:predicted nucleotidyltransferase